MAGNPSNNWWNNMVMNTSMHPHEYSHDHHHHQQSSSSSTTTTQHFYGSSNFLADNNLMSQDHLPRSWSQLLLAGLSCDQEKSDISQFQHQYKKLEDWEEIQNLNSIHNNNNNNNNNNNTPCSSNFRVPVVDVVKPEMVGQLLYGNYQDLPATSSPASSCVTTNLGHSNIFNFSPSPNKITTTNKVVEPKHQHHPDHSSECNSTSSGGVTKKARVQHSSAQPSLKVRKEKLGDRITALHQLVSPFGKTDTASVLSEAIGYIRFLQAQIQALSSPYMGNVAGSMGHTHQQSDLRSRGLCLVSTSCTQHVGSDNNTSVGDYWAPALGGGYL